MIKNEKASSKNQPFKEGTSSKSIKTNDCRTVNKVPKSYSKEAYTETGIPSNYSGSDIDSSNHRLGIRQRIIKERTEGYRLRGHLHGKLHNCSTDDERYEIAKKIIDLQPKLIALNRDLDELDSGTIPSRFIQHDSSIDEFLRIRNLKYYIERYKRKIETASSIKQKNDWNAKLQQYESELRTFL